MFARNNNSQLLLVLLAAATTTTLFSSHHIAHATPSLPTATLQDDIAKQSSEAAKYNSGEVDDMNMQIAFVPIDAAPGYSSREFTHRDEDQSQATQNFNLRENFKYAVELLDPQDTQPPEVELEERYRGAAALQVNRDTFTDEDIELNAKDNVAVVIVQQGHLMLTIILIALAVASIAAYAALVVWRARLEQRYGMRQLLVMNDEDAFEVAAAAANADHNCRQLSAAGQV